MDKLDNIFNNARTEIPDNGFSSALMERIKAENIQPNRQDILLEQFRPKRFTVLRNVAITTAACLAISVFALKSERFQDKIVTLAQNTTEKISSFDLAQEIEDKFDLKIKPD